MGGNLFSSKRINQEEYNTLSAEVLEIIKNKGHAHSHVAIPHTFKDKKDYGDIDVCLEIPKFTTNEIMSMFSIPREDISWNSSVASLKYKDFQIDLCFFPSEDLQSAINYMQFGDLSNMVGVICSQALGMRYTHRGLVAPIRLKKEDMLGEVVICRDIERIFDFIDLDYYQWDKGFNNENETFEWISRSKYFNKKYFAFDELNHQNRTRNRKRAMYSRFVTWLEDKTFENNYESDSHNKVDHIWRSVLAFGWWLNDAVPFIKERERNIAAHNKWNAEDIIRLTGKTGKDLGNCIAGFKKSLDARRFNNYTSYILNYSKEEIENEFMKWYKTFNV
jgi:hypothetical protein